MDFIFLKCGQFQATWGWALGIKRKFPESPVYYGVKTPMNGALTGHNIWQVCGSYITFMHKFNPHPNPHEKDDQPLEDWSWISIFVLFISVNLDAMRRPFGKSFHMMLYWGTTHVLRNRHKFGANLVVHRSFAKCESNKCPVINGYWWQTGNRKSDHALGINRNKGLLAWYNQDVGLLKTAT